MIVVNDRSSDGTGEQIDRIAREHSRVRALHVTELPDAWLGKVHAMEYAREICRGEWILFVDSDVRLSRAALRRRIAYARRGLEFLTAVRTISPLGPADRRGGHGICPRRLRKAGGLEWLRLEVADDVALGLLKERPLAGEKMYPLAARGRCSSTRSDSRRALRSEFLRGIRASGTSTMASLTPRRQARVLLAERKTG